jgi:hypothetical protein
MQELAVQAWDWLVRTERAVEQDVEFAVVDFYESCAFFFFLSYANDSRLSALGARLCLVLVRFTLILPHC